MKTVEKKRSQRTKEKRAAITEKDSKLGLEVSLDHLFPYHLFQRGERVVIYGAGDIGRKFYSQAMDEGYVEIVAVLDARAEEITDFKAEVPESIRDMEYDSVLIAVNRKKIVASIRRTLRNLGVPQEKIKCDYEVYYHEHFYRSFYWPLIESLGLKSRSYLKVLEKVQELQAFQGRIAVMLECAPDQNSCLQKLEEKLLFSHRHHFPFHLFHEGERVIIYGAGDIGREFYREATQQPYVKILAIMDRNADNLIHLPMPVAHLDILDRFDYDSILISIHDEYVAEEVTEMLVKRGVSREKIKWDGKRYYQDEYYQNYKFELMRFLEDIGESRV